MGANWKPLLILLRKSVFFCSSKEEGVSRTAFAAFDTPFSLVMDPLANQGF